MTERRDLYDINRKLTGKTVAKGEPTPDGSYIIVVLVFIQNEDGKFLIQRRSRKYKDGKLATTGGHVKAGTTSVEGILEEIEEELGITLRPEDLELYYTDREDSTRVFFDDYYARADVDLADLKLQDNEVDEALWMTTDEIMAAVDEGDFLSNHVEEFERLLTWLNK